MYAEEAGSIIDGVDNAKQHAFYIKSILDLAEVEVLSLCDFGFGNGILLKEFVMKLKPKLIIAIDPSKEAIDQLKKQSWITKLNHKIYQTTIEKLDQSKINKPFDLGICNSIVQYIPNKDITFVFQKMATLCKYLYFSVPTIADYNYMLNELEFTDPYANKRTKKFYLNRLSPYFTIVSYNLLESKSIPSGSGFVYEFFRF